MTQIDTLARRAEELKERQFPSKTPLSLAQALEAKEKDSHHHSLRVADLCVQLGESLGLSSQEKRLLWVSGLLHDIGKIGVNESTLLKPRPLTQEEWQAMKLHPLIGETISQPLNAAPEIASAIKYHHERWDGQGYPHGLKEEQIPLFARVLAVADTYDAIVSPRPYRPTGTHREAISVLLKESGKQFDPAIVSVALKALSGL